MFCGTDFGMYISSTSSWRSRRTTQFPWLCAIPTDSSTKPHAVATKHASAWSVTATIHPSIYPPSLPLHPFSPFFGKPMLMPGIWAALFTTPWNVLLMWWVDVNRCYYHTPSLTFLPGSCTTVFWWVISRIKSFRIVSSPTLLSLSGAVKGLWETSAALEPSKT